MNAIAFEEPRTMNRDGYKSPARTFRPIRLRALLVARSISHDAIAAAVKQKNGRPLSRTALSFLMNYGDWPASTPKDAIRAQVERFLSANGAEPGELADIWLRDDAAQANLNQRGAHGPHAVSSKREPPQKDLIEIPEREMLNPAARKHFQIFRDPFIDEIREHMRTDHPALLETVGREDLLGWIQVE